MKALKLAGALLAGLVIAGMLALIAGIPASVINPRIAARVERESGYRMSIAGATRIGLWPSLELDMNDITLDDPRDQDGSHRITIGRATAEMPLSSAWSNPEISSLSITSPVIHVPLLRERPRESAASARPAEAAETTPVAIDRVKVTDGTVVFANHKDRVERRIDAIEADATIGADRELTLSGTARAGTHPLRFKLLSALPAQPRQRPTIPVDLTLEAPGSLSAPLSAKAELSLHGPVLMINGVSGQLGEGSFSGWASVDAASKPIVKVDMDFKRLDVTPPTAAPSQWSDEPFDLVGLSYVDGELSVSAADIGIGPSHFAPGAASATLAGGVLKATVTNLGAYGGNATGGLTIDATAGTPTFTMHGDVVAVSALPFLTAVADFDKIDGKMQAKIAGRSEGLSPHAIISNLSGTAFASFRDGEIRGINIAQMIRSLTKNPLSGWQLEKEQATDLSQLSASFRIDRGEATTTDLSLVGPLVRVTGAGTVDLTNRSLAFRVEPKLALTTQGQGSKSDPVAFGIPVVVSGPWTEPRIYPEIAGVLDNPDAAYAKLREMGKGLFGDTLKGILGSGGQAGANDDPSGQLGEALGKLIQQGLGGRTISPGPQDNPTDAPNDAPKAAPQGGGTAPGEDNQDSAPMTDVLRQLFNR